MQSGAGQLRRSFFFGAALACAAMAAQAEPILRQTTNLIWARDDSWFGGFSGMEITGQGSDVTLISDRRTLVLGQLTRQDGQLIGIRIHKVMPVRHADGRIVRGFFADTEGLAIGQDGTTYLSFEHATRVAELSRKTGITKRLPDHPDFARMKPNKGLEALAIHPNGALYTLPERTPPHRETIPLYAFSENNWRLAHLIPRRGPFMSVGADFDHKGRFYLLERAVTPLGFRSRIRRFDLSEPDLGEVTLLTTRPGNLDNMEALSVWRDADGRIQVTLISDDNFQTIQRTQIVEYVLTE